MTINIDLSKLPTHVLKRVIKFKEKIETLEHGMAELIKEALSPDSDEIPSPFATKARGRKKMSAKTRAKMAEAAKLRWAKKKGVAVKPKKGRRKMSAATKAKMAASAKARWAAAKKAGKTTL